MPVRGAAVLPGAEERGRPGATGQGAGGVLAHLGVLVIEQRQQQAMGRGGIRFSQFPDREYAHRGVHAADHPAPLGLVEARGREALNEVEHELRHVRIGFIDIREHLPHQAPGLGAGHLHSLERDQRVPPDVDRQLGRGMLQENGASRGLADVADEQEARREHTLLGFGARRDLPVHGGPILGRRLRDVAAYRVAGFLHKFEIGVEEELQNRLERPLRVNARQQIDQDEPLLAGRLLELLPDLGHDFAACLGDEGDGPELRLGVVGAQQGHRVGNHRARSDRLEGLQDVSRQKLGGFLERFAQSLHHFRILRGELRQHDGGGRAPHAVGALEQVADLLESTIHRSGD